MLFYFMNVFIVYKILKLELILRRNRQVRNIVEFDRVFLEVFRLSFSYEVEVEILNGNYCSWSYIKICDFRKVKQLQDIFLLFYGYIYL